MSWTANGWKRKKFSKWALTVYFGLRGFEGTQSRCVRGAQLAKNNRLPLVHILSQMNSIHSQLSYVFNFSFKRLRWSRVACCL